MIKRLEQVAALVVAAGLAIVSYWLFFSWAQGGGSERRLPTRQSQLLPASETAAGLDQPLACGTVIEAAEMLPHFLGRHRQILARTDLDDACKSAGRILQCLAEQGLGEIVVSADAPVQLGGVAVGHGGVAAKG